MTSIAAASSNNYQSPAAAAAGRTAVGSQLRRHQFVRSDRAFLGADGYQFLAAGRQRGRLGQRSKFRSRRFEVEDRQPDCGRGVERQAHQRPGHRTARGLQGRVRQWRRRSGRCRRCERRDGCWRSGSDPGLQAPGPRTMAITATTAARPLPTLRHRRAAVRAAHRTPVPPTTFCSSFSNRCRIRCRPRHPHPTARAARPTPATPARRQPRLF